VDNREVLFGQLELKERFGVEAGVAKLDAEVKVGAGGPAGGPDAPDLLAFLDALTHGDVGRLQVEVEGEEAEAVVEDHKAARKEHLIDHRNHAAVRRANRSA
jgi:hypothetical protein